MKEKYRVVSIKTDRMCDCNSDDPCPLNKTGDERVRCTQLKSVVDNIPLPLKQGEIMLDLSKTPNTTLYDEMIRNVTMRTGIHMTHEAEEAVRVLLRFIGQDPKEPGLVDTPKRVVRALKEMTSGYLENPKDILGKVFEDSYDEVIILKGIPFVSTCEHHMLTFSGTCDVGYIPSKDQGKVVGLSKLARLVDVFAKRLQIQERMTRQIAESLMDVLSPRGVAVVVRAVHSCMACRGVKKSGAEMVTSCMLGEFRDSSSARSEFFALTMTK